MTPEYRQRIDAMACRVLEACEQLGYGVRVALVLDWNEATGSGQHGEAAWRIVGVNDEEDDKVAETVGVLHTVPCLRLSESSMKDYWMVGFFLPWDRQAQVARKAFYRLTKRLIDMGEQLCVDMTFSYPEYLRTVDTILVRPLPEWCCPDVREDAEMLECIRELAR